MISAPYAGPIENVVVVMLERRSYGDVLDALEAAMMPIATFLGRQFMLCDGWVVSSPRARANMLTANCAAHGNSERGVVDLEPNLFSALDAARGVRFGARGTRVPNWKVYFHDYSILGNALAYVARCYDDPANLNVANYDERDYPPGARNPLAAPTTTFLQDVAQNVLPAYAFIEPRHRSGRWDPSRDESTGGSKGQPFELPILREILANPIGLRAGSHTEIANGEGTDLPGRVQVTLQEKR